MKVILRSKALLSAIITIVLLFSFQILCTPILDSDDNFYILYKLAGGYGQPPTYLLHYFYEWHPLLFWPIEKFFSLASHFNWYTGFLLLLQFIGCAHLFYLFLELFSRGMAVILAILFFFFFESAYLLSLNHSNTSFLLAISGCSSLLCYFKIRDLSTLAGFRKLAFPFALILLSGLLRVPTLGLYLLLTVGMGLVILPFPSYRRMLLSLAFVGALLLGLMTAHKLYYIDKIPQYEREEQFRQSLFYLANHPTTPPQGERGITRIKSSFIQSWFLYDTGFVNQGNIDAYTQKTVQNRLHNTEENRAILYWTFINSRVYLLLLSVILLAFLSLRYYKEAQKWLQMSLPGLLVYAFLILYMKVTEGIFIAILSSFFFSAVFCFSSKTIKKASFTPALLLLLFLNTAWMLVRIYKSNEANLNEIKETRALLKEISAHPQFLFISTDMEFKDGGFYIWDTPLQYPLSNLLHKELLVTNNYRPTLERFGIRDLVEELPYRTDILLFNRVDPLLKEYYLMKGMNTELKVVPGFTTLTAYRIEAK